MYKILQGKTIILRKYNHIWKDNNWSHWYVLPKKTKNNKIANSTNQTLTTNTSCKHLQWALKRGWSSNLLCPWRNTLLAGEVGAGNNYSQSNQLLSFICKKKILFILHYCHHFCSTLLYWLWEHFIHQLHCWDWRTWTLCCHTNKINIELIASSQMIKPHPQFDCIIQITFADVKTKISIKGLTQHSTVCFKLQCLFNLQSYILNQFKHLLRITFGNYTFCVGVYCAQTSAYLNLFESHSTTTNHRIQLHSITGTCPWCLQLSVNVYVWEYIRALPRHSAPQNMLHVCFVFSPKVFCLIPPTVLR